MTGRVVAAACADQIAGPDDLLGPAFVEGHRDAVAVGLDRRCLDAELDLKALPGQMVAQRLLGKPLRLAALELVFAPQTCEFCEPDAHLSWAEKLDLLDVHALFQERLDHAGLVEDLKRRGLKCGAARIVMGRRLLLDDPWPYAVTEELACGEKARGTRADDEDLSIGPGVYLSGLLRHFGFPPSFFEL
ncbi:MAG TPA: hypothetical protein VFE60_07455 [Roseiarcus sp.]|nr:hypothetical protein [Roseiarcus sp.]